MGDVRWRDATTDDLEAIVAVERECFAFPWPLSAFRQELNLPFASIVLAERALDGGMLGCVDYWGRGDQSHLWVRAGGGDHRRRGVGRELVRRAEVAGARCRARYASLEVRAGNDAALAFYRALGYAHVGVKRGYYSDSGEDALVLMKFLQPDAEGGEG